jgi:hypothetical protein
VRSGRGQHQAEALAAAGLGSVPVFADLAAAINYWLTAAAPQ